MIYEQIIKFACLVVISGVFSMLYAKYDAAVIHLRRVEKNGKNLQHKFRTVVRFAFCALLGVCAYGFTWMGLLAFLVSVQTFYLIFDLYLNDEREMDPFYLGYTSDIDRFAVKLFDDNVEKAGLVMFIVELTLWILWSVLYYLVEFTGRLLAVLLFAGRFLLFAVVLWF